MVSSRRRFAREFRTEPVPLIVENNQRVEDVTTDLNFHPIAPDKMDDSISRKSHRGLPRKR